MTDTKLTKEEISDMCSGHSDPRWSQLRDLALAEIGRRENETAAPQVPLMVTRGSASVEVDSTDTSSGVESATSVKDTCVASSVVAAATAQEPSYHLSTDEQKAMKRALLKSSTLVQGPVGMPGPRWVFTCPRPQHTNVHDEHVLKEDYDLLRTRCEQLSGLLAKNEGRVTEIVDEHLLRRAEQAERQREECRRGELRLREVLGHYRASHQTCVDTARCNKCRMADTALAQHSEDKP